MAWDQAKLLRDALIDAIERYEIANGELKWPALAAQNLKEAIAEQILKNAPERIGKVN